ncbi:hypothetical protein BDA96_02G204400 [Sorghum bicolor]|uniref:Uncharacterized protein n=1 Tax=Sorghum bicolor TaxID=4558 RepID=A0A921RPQ5_SORBI|nr:hypothetical protein BDA96_02G204400 [Sorghum bicolor]
MLRHGRGVHAAVRRPGGRAVRRGVWVCGLCAEPIKDEAARRGVGLDAARRAHAEFVVSAGSGRPAAQVVRALLQLINAGGTTRDARWK